MSTPLRHLVLAGLLLLTGTLFAAGGDPGETVLEGGVNPGYHEPPAWFKESFLDLRDDLAEASEQGRRLLLYFQQDGCPYCAKLITDNFGDAAIAAQTRASYDTIAINIWGDREVVDLQGETTTEKDFSAALRVQYTPTLLILDEQGEVVLRINGYYPPTRFRQALAYGRGEAGEVLPGESLAAFITRKNGQPTADLIEVEEGLFMRPPYLLDRSRLRAQHPLLVLFEAADCAACSELHTDVMPRAEIRTLLEQFDRVRLNRNGSERLITPSGERSDARSWADQLGIDYTPALVFFDERGDEVFRIEAYLRPFHYAAALRYVAEGVWREQPNFQRFVQAVADEKRERGEAVDLWQ